MQKELLYLRVPQEADPKVDLRRGSERAVRLDLAIQYIAAEAKDFSFLYGKMKDVLSKLRNEYAEVYLGEGR